MEFKELFKPGYVGKLKVKNRIKFAGTGTLLSSMEGEVSDAETIWLAERARGGAGITTTAGTDVHRAGRGMPGEIRNHDDGAIPGLTKLNKAIKNNGSASICQLLHYGRYAKLEEGSPVLDASGVPPLVPRFGQSRAATKEEIKEINDAYAEAADRAKRVGFDGIELASFFHESFLWPWCNLRQDEYGGSLENQARAMIEAVEGIKRKVGKDYPLVVRLHVEGVTRGDTSDRFRQDARKIAKWLEEAGMDAISLMVGNHESDIPAVTRDKPRGHWLYLAEGMKKVLKVPVMLSFRLSAEIAEKAIKDGILDFWEISRPLICDPDLPRKLEEGRPEDVIPCVSCNDGCFNRVWHAQPIRCLVNPRAGREADERFRISPAAEKKRVVVVGGGPGGMEAALIAAIRGHDVTLFEKTSALGGQLLLAAKTPYCDEMANIADYFSIQLKKAGVKVERNKEVNASLIKQVDGDVVIVATGSSTAIPEMPVEKGSKVFTAHEVLAGEVEVGRNVVVSGGNQIGVQTAELLASQGKQVTLVEQSRKVGTELSIWDRHHFIVRLKEARVKILKETTVKEIKPQEVTLVTKEGVQKVLADAVVFARPRKADKKLMEDIRLESGEVYAVGDCVAPRRALNAISEGFQIGNKI